MVTPSVVFAKCQKCFPYYSSGAITTAIKHFKGNAGLTKEGFPLQSEREHQQMRTPQSQFTKALAPDASMRSVQCHKSSLDWKSSGVEAGYFTKSLAPQRSQCCT